MIDFLSAVIGWLGGNILYFALFLASLLIITLAIRRVEFEAIFVFILAFFATYGLIYNNTIFLITLIILIVYSALMLARIFR